MKQITKQQFREGMEAGKIQLLDNNNKVSINGNTYKIEVEIYEDIVRLIKNG